MGIEEQLGVLLDRIEELEKMVGNGIQLNRTFFERDEISISQAITEIAPDGLGIRERWVEKEA